MKLRSPNGAEPLAAEGRLRVLVLHWGNNGGGPKFTYDMAQGLSTQPNIDVVASFSAYADNASAWNTLQGPRLVVKTYRSSAEFALSGLRWIRAVLALRRFIKQHDVQVVYSGMLSLWQSLALPYTLPRNVTYVASIHDAVEHPGDEHILKQIARRKELKRADIVAVYSEHAASGVRSQVPAEKQILRLRIGADTIAAEPRTLDSGNQIVLGFFGRIVEYKGIDLFVEVVRLLRSRGVNVKGAVYGQGSLAGNVIADTSSFIDWHVRWIDNEEISGIFREIDVVVLPYKEASQSAVLTQAIGFGVPVVATPVGGLAEQVSASKAGLVSKSLDVGDLANSIEALVTNSDAYSAFSTAGLDAARTHLSWHAVASDLVSTLSEKRIDGSRSGR